MELSDQLHVQATLPAGHNLCIHWIWGWMGYGVEMDVLEREVTLLPSPGYEPRLVQLVA